MAYVFAAMAVVVAGIVGLGRQVTVFAAWERGLGIFRHYPKKRLYAAVTSLVLFSISWLLYPSRSLIPFAIATTLFLTLAFLFRLEWLFPELNSVDSVPADAAGIADNTDVVLVTIKKTSAVDSEAQIVRAYPLKRMVIARHLVHDVIDGVSIVVTYCALCRSGLVFRTEVGGRAAHFSVVGVFRRNLIMEDNVSHTLWQQATGRALFGPHEGRTLELLPSQQLPFHAARSVCGATLTVATEPQHVRKAPFASDRGYRLLEFATNRVTVRGHTTLSPVLPKRETVFGLVLNGEAKAYPVSRCRFAGMFFDTVGGAELIFTYDDRSPSLNVQRRDGRPAPVVEKHWWLGWNEFHPNTTIWNGENDNTFRM